MAKNCWLFILAVCCLAGQLAMASPPRYVVDRAWTSNEGLPENAVIAMTQTRDGYLWLGTLNGLARFDGLQFSIFDEGNTPELNSSKIVRLFEDSQGNFWVGTDTAGVVRVDRTGHISGIGIGRQSHEGRLMGICEDANGAVWLYTADGQLGRYRAEPGTNATSREGHFDVWGPDNTTSACRAIIADDSGLVWVGTDSKLTAYGPFTGGASVGLPLAHELSGAELGKLDLLLASKQGGYWRFSNRLIQKCRGVGVERRFSYPWSTNASVSVACEDQRGNLIVGTLSEGLFLFDRDGHHTHLGKVEGLSDDYILSLCADREGTLWIGTDGGGVNRAKPEIFEMVNGPGGSPAQTVCEDKDGGLWIGFNGGGVAYWKDGRLLRYALLTGPASYVRAVLVDGSSNVWAGTRGGLFRLGAGSWTEVPMAIVENGIASIKRLPPVSAIYQDGAGALWFGTQDGLIRKDAERWTQFTRADGLGANDVRALVNDKQGNLWIGTEGGGLNLFRDDKFTVYRKAQGLPSDNIFSLYLDAEGVLWAGTSSGLARLKDGKWTRYSKDEGLISNSAGYIVEDAEGYFWIGSNAGLMRVQRQDLAGFVTNSIRVRSYGKTEGLPAGECTFGSQPAACRTRDGRLWFPTIKGLVFVDPARLTPNTNPPPVLIESVRIDGRLQQTNSLRAPVPETIIVPPRSENLEITFASLNLSDPEKGRFRYGFAGHEMAERRGGESGARSPQFTLLPPGDYMFQVTACNEDGVWNRSWTTLQVKVLPPFWRTWWFMSLVGAAVLTVIISFVHYVSTQRLQRQIAMLRQKEAVEKERARIARDIHDQVGANLTQVSLLGELVESDKNDPGEIAAHGRQISQTALETTRALDEIVWTVNPSNDTLDSLITYLCKYTQEYLAMAGLRYRLEAPEALPPTPISPELRHNVFLAAKEAVNNVVKHAHAQSMWMRLLLDSDRFVLEIEDDGLGLDPAAEKKGRNGLRNMRKRMEEIGGQFEAGARNGKGTKVRLVVPLNVNRGA